MWLGDRFLVALKGTPWCMERYSLVQGRVLIGAGKVTPSGLEFDFFRPEQNLLQAWRFTLKRRVTFSCRRLIGYECTGVMKGKMNRNR